MNFYYISEKVYLVSIYMIGMLQVSEKLTYFHHFLKLWSIEMLSLALENFHQILTLNSPNIASQPLIYAAGQQENP